MVDKFEELIQENSVYIISGGIIKEAAPKYATVKHEFCIVFEKSTTIELIEDDGTVSGGKGNASNCFSFCTIASLETLNAHEQVDVIGVVQRIGPIGQVTIKSGEPKRRRNLVICDDSKTSICICVWGEKVDMDFSDNPVISIKGAKVSDYFQRSLNAYDDSRIYLNAEFPRSKDIKEWYDSTA